MFKPFCLELLCRGLNTWTILNVCEQNVTQTGPIELFLFEQTVVETGEGLCTPYHRLSLGPCFVTSAGTLSYNSEP